MRVSEQVSFEEVLSCYKGENFQSHSFAYGEGLLRTANTKVVGRVDSCGSFE
jgi:hypothetical protein